jgi:hypothetical protein
MDSPSRMRRQHRRTGGTCHCAVTAGPPSTIAVGPAVEVACARLLNRPTAPMRATLEARR